MKRLKYVVLALSAAVAFVIVITSIQERYAANNQKKREASYASDMQMDRDFERRPRAPLEIRAMLKTSNQNYIGVEADRPSFRNKVSAAGKLPAIIFLPGCGLAVSGADVPPNVVMLSIHENREVLGRESSFQACDSRNGEAVRSIITEHLTFMTNFIDHADWIDRDRLLISGYGEAAPIVVNYDGRAKTKLILGDSCLVAWPSSVSDQNLIMLFTSDRKGIQRDSSTEALANGKAIAQGNMSSLPRAKSCLGLERPLILPPARQSGGGGRNWNALGSSRVVQGTKDRLPKFVGC